MCSFISLIVIFPWFYATISNKSNNRDEDKAGGERNRDDDCFILLLTIQVILALNNGICILTICESRVATLFCTSRPICIDYLRISVSGSRLNEAFFKHKIANTTLWVNVFDIENTLRVSEIILGLAWLSCEKKSEPKNIFEANH